MDSTTNTMTSTVQSYQSLARPSHNTIWKVLPYVGVGSIVLAICCAAAALAVGLISDGMPQDTWKLLGNTVQPSVLLSLSATLANALLRVAFTEGFAITWWSQAHGGISVGKLTAMFDHAYTFQSLFQLSNGSRVTMASVAMLLLLADGPFLQRASNIRREPRTQIRHTVAPVSPSPLNTGSTGVMTTHDIAMANIYTPEFAQVVQQYNARENYSIPSLQFPGITTLTLVAPGWDVQCQNGSSPYRLINMEEYAHLANGQNSTYKPPPVSQIMFETNSRLAWGDLDEPRNSQPYQLQLYASYKSTPGDNGTKLWRACNLSEAIVRYPLHIDNGAVSLQAMPLSVNRTEQLIVRNYEEGGWGDLPSTLGGFSLAVQQQFTTSANLTVAPGLGFTIRTDNAIANQYIDRTANLSTLSTSDVTWTDPIDDILAMANELAIRTAISLTNFSYWSDNKPTNAQPDIIYPNLTLVNRTISQNITTTTTESGNFYHTSKGWLAGGVAVILFNCVLVMPMYWAWWRLERPFAMNPLDIAKAFDAPVLRDADAFTPPTDWDEPVKKMKVRYGRGLAESKADVSFERFKNREGFSDEQDEMVQHEDGDEQSAHLYQSDNVASRHVPKFRKMQ